MKLSTKISVGAVLIVSALSLAGLALAAATSVSLGSADSFSVLADTAISDAAPASTVISGNVGLGPTSGGSSITGLTTAAVAGTIYAMDSAGPAGAAGNDPTLINSAQSSLTTAYNTVAGETPIIAVTASSVDSFGSGTINNGANLTPGIYTSGSSIGVTGTLTLDGGGNANAVFIFQAGSTLTTASGAVISLINGAQACNVFWQVGSSATLGTGTTFRGNILAHTSITDTSGSTVFGRLLASTGAVSLSGTRITNATCVAPPASVISGTTGAHYFENLPHISITKIPSPLALPQGAGSVTYTYAVTNVGTAPMHTVWVKDDKCSPVTYASGDTNNNSILDLNETWTYRCTKTVSQTETNTATAHGYANGIDVYDTANAMVVVGSALPPPLIHLVKIPSVFVLPAGGGPVTYSYSVTNPGTAPLSDVSITDNKCTGLPGRVAGNPGDINKNNLLDPGETWHFTCQSNITQTTTNIGTAEGSANGLVAIDFAPATVVVNPPGLPNTGLPPEGTNTPWDAILAAGVLFLVSTSFMVLKKRSA